MKESWQNKELTVRLLVPQSLQTQFVWFYFSLLLVACVKKLTEQWKSVKTQRCAWEHSGLVVRQICMFELQLWQLGCMNKFGLPLTTPFFNRQGTGSILVHTQHLELSFTSDLNLNLTWSESHLNLTRVAPVDRLGSEQSQNPQSSTVWPDPCYPAALSLQWTD